MQRTKLLQSIFALTTWALTTVAWSQATFSGDAVQQELDAAIASGAGSYTLPGGKILLNSALVIPIGVRNFTLQGRSGTRLVRNSTQDFSLIVVGNGGWHAYTNEVFSDLPQVTISPVAEGASTITRTGGVAAVPGWYGLIGTHPTDDIVRHMNGSSVYWFKRELVEVTAVNGNTLTLAQPVGRAFANGQLRLIEAAGATGLNRHMTSNITVRDMILDGRSEINGAYTSKIFNAGLCNGLTIDDISVMGFDTAGINVKMSKGVLITRIRATDSNLTANGYGIELAGTRFATIRNSTFTRVRTGVLLQSGNMDTLIEDCNSPTTNFDAGHGTGELRVTYRRTVGSSFAVANPSWRRGADRVLFEDCTALNYINIYGNASNVTIRGKHPSYSQTTPLISLFTDSGGSAIPSGATYPLSVTLENGSSIRGLPDGVSMRLHSPTGGPRMLGNLTIRNWNFHNQVGEFGANINFAGITNSPTVLVENSSFRIGATWNAPIYVGQTAEGQFWNLIFRNNRFNGPGYHMLWLDTGSSAQVTSDDNTWNGVSVTNTHVRGAQGLRSPL